MTGSIYSARKHQRALNEHERLWKRMHAIRLEKGTDNDEYRETRQAMVDAMRAVRWIARAPKRRP